MDIILKQIIAENKGYLWRVYENAMKSHISIIWGWNLDWQKDNFEKSLEKYETYIVYRSKNKMGYVQVLYDFERTYINMLILEPMYQSKGLGGEVLRLAAMKQKDKSIELRCFKINLEAYEFYLRLGFKVIGVEDEYYYMGKQPTERNRCMNLNLDDKMS